MRANAQQGVLPPLVSGQSLGGQNNSVLNNPQGYQQYAYRPSKLRSLNQKLGNQGLSGEKIRLNQYSSQDKIGNGLGQYDQQY